MQSNATAPAAPAFPPGYLEASRAPSVVGTSVAFIVIDTIATILRAFARRLQPQGFMWSDVYMLLSLLFNIGLSVCCLLAVHWGAGRHAAAVPHTSLRPFIILSYYGITWVYLFAVAFSKLAILDLYLHIIRDRISRWISYLTAAVIVLNSVVNLIAGLNQCHPFDYLWNPTPGGGCDNTLMHFIWASFPNIITDIVMLVLPIPTIIRLQTSWQNKFGVLLTFLVGSVGLVTSIIRFVVFYKYSWNYSKQGWTTTNSDAMWSDSFNLIWTVIEPGVYHIAACMITFRPLFRWFFGDSPVSTVIKRTRSVWSERSSSHSGRNFSQRSKRWRDDASPDSTPDTPHTRPARALEKLGTLDAFPSQDSTWSQDLEDIIWAEHSGGLEGSHRSGN